MEHISEWIRSRRSVRTFDGQALRAEDLDNLRSFMESIENPYELPVEFKMMNAKESGLTCPVVSGTLADPHITTDAEYIDSYLIEQ